MRCSAGPPGPAARSAVSTTKTPVSTAPVAAEKVLHSRWPLSHGAVRRKHNGVRGVKAMCILARPADRRRAVVARPRPQGLARRIARLDADEIALEGHFGHLDRDRVPGGRAMSTGRMFGPHIQLQVLAPARHAGADRASNVPFGVSEPRRRRPRRAQPRRRRCCSRPRKRRRTRWRGCCRCRAGVADLLQLALATSRPRGRDIASASPWSWVM